MDDEFTSMPPGDVAYASLVARSSKRGVVRTSSELKDGLVHVGDDGSGSLGEVVDQGAGLGGTCAAILYCVHLKPLATTRWQLTLAPCLDQCPSYPYNGMA